MNSLPSDLENIIMTMKYEMEHQERFKDTLNTIKNIHYICGHYETSPNVFSPTIIYSERGEYSNEHNEPMGKEVHYSINTTKNKLQMETFYNGYKMYDERNNKIILTHEE